MSGLAGLFRIGGPAETAPLLRMARALDARGPDGRVEEPLPVGALAVTVGAPGEPDGGVAWDPSRRWCVAADGELLNARALLAELRAWGEEPGETSAAIAAAMFATRGFEGALERLAGDVAIVAWDATERRLWAARDRAGLRPLHWAALPDGTLLVASEPAALLAHPGVDPAPDPDALREALAFGAPLPPRTPWRAVRALAPGELVTWDGGAPAVKRWWDDAANPSGADGARYRWARSVQFGTELAIQQRVAVDVPVAVALSGGVYAEALLVGAAARRREPILALTLDAEGAVPEGRAAATAARARAKHVVVPLPVRDVAGLLAETVANEPLLAPEALGWRALTRAAFDGGAEVLLTGVGGASLYGGTPFPLVERAASLPGLGVFGRAARAGARGGEGWAHRHVRRRLEVDDAPWTALDALVGTCPSTDPTGGALWLERRLDAGVSLAVLDRAAAAHGLRAQSPYADAPLVKLVATVPIGHLVQVRRPRGLFLDALAERLAPEPPGHRPMDLPVAAWLDAVGTAGVAEALEGVLPGDTTRAALDPRAPARRRW
ncbi:MAG: asparagine synthase-related protein, partial [Myxococcota bacterium]